MSTTDSPLRYPGGKTQLASLIGRFLTANHLQGGHYAEPFAGGAGLAWRLLFTGQVGEIWLNDIDPAIYAFWFAAVHQTDALCLRIQGASITIDEWHRQREVFETGGKTELDRAFATLFLNRTNRSGILRGGVIGGLQQEGKYKLSCRFNKHELIRKIRRIGRYRAVVHLSNEDARQCLVHWDEKLPKRALFNIDPPYYGKGSGLYTNYFRPGDHASLSEYVRRLNHRWVMTYDCAPEIAALYQGLPVYETNLLYSLQTKRVGTELLVVDPELEMPHLEAA